MSFSALADDSGGEAGGGENAVVCFDDVAIPIAIRDQNSVRFGQILDEEIKSHLVSVEAYDLFEAKMARGMSGIVPQIIDVAPSESARDYVERIVKRFENYIPNIADAIRTGASAFPEDKIILRPAGLDRYHDEHDVGYIDSVHCVVATMARQYHSGDQIFLQIDRRLFQSPKHSQLSRAVLFLHESVYYSARTYAKHENSRATRALVGSIIDQAAQDVIKLGGLYRDLHMPDFRNGFSNSLAVHGVFWVPKIKEIATLAAKRVSVGKSNSRLVEEYNAYERWMHPGEKPASDDSVYSFFGGGGYALRKSGVYFGSDEQPRDAEIIRDWPNAHRCRNSERNSEGGAAQCVALQRSIKNHFDGLRKMIAQAAHEAAVAYVKTVVIPDLQTRLAVLGGPVLDKAKDLYLSEVDKGGPREGDDLLFSIPNLPGEFDGIDFPIP